MALKEEEEFCYSNRPLNNDHHQPALYCGLKSIQMLELRLKKKSPLGAID
eukprot:CAMPEP_0196818152 /NCGR_PEP_ID=MMETSP1362-20130617/64247_1 /TAXON_ID=163516 /ORGANISM="Leptocylindrus danicus, Strain CCMP1856" /LENGTH=49 /DNA_ID=CAMNT_0042196123 /DNA_START=61 /DNA_END=210 /DNA_ORIENTATION=-